MSPGIIVYNQHQPTPNSLCINQLTTKLPLYKPARHRPPTERPSLNEGKNGHKPPHRPNTARQHQHPTPCPHDNTQHPTTLSPSVPHSLTPSMTTPNTLPHQRQQAAPKWPVRIRTHDAYTAQMTENSRIRPVRGLCLPLWPVGV